MTDDLPNEAVSFFTFVHLQLECFQNKQYSIN